MSAPTTAELADQIAVLRRIVSGLTAADVRTEAEIEQAEADEADAQKDLEAQQKKEAKAEQDAADAAAKAQADADEAAAKQAAKEAAKA